MKTSGLSGNWSSDQTPLFLMPGLVPADGGAGEDVQDEKLHFLLCLRAIQAGFLLCLLTFLLAGCATPPPPSPPASPPPAPAVPPPEIVTITVPSEIDKFFSYYQGLQRLPPGELRAALGRLDAQPWTVWSALKKTAILSLLPGSDEVARTQALLDSLLYSGDPEATQLKPLIQLLARNFSERKRLIDQVESLHQQNREAQRRIVQLNQMLEGLKAIERSLPAHSADKAQELRSVTK